MLDDGASHLLPLLDSDGVCRALAGLSASSHCPESCRQQQLHCPPTHVLSCFADRRRQRADPLACFRDGTDAQVDCSCVSPLFPPAENLTGRFGVALVIAGQTRSFTSPAVHSAFTAMVSMLRPAEAAVMAVLSTESTNRGDLRPGGWAAETRFTTRALTAVLSSFDIPHRAHYLSNSAGAAEAAAACHDRGLRSLLMAGSQSRTLQQGFHNSHIKRVVALDLLLSYERSTLRSPERVLFLRPDIAYTLAPSALATACSRGVYVSNDVFASMPRGLAGYYLTSYAMLLSIHGVGVAPPNATLLGQAKEAASPEERGLGGLVGMPHFHLAYHGVPFAGTGLEMLPNHIDCAGYRPVLEHLIMRDLPTNRSEDMEICYTGQPASRGTGGLLDRFNVAACHDVVHTLSN